MTFAELRDRAMLELSRFYVRHAPIRFGRGYAYNVGKARARRLGRIVARTRDGAQLSCDGGDFLQRSIMFFGIWEPRLTDLIRRSLKPGDVFVDVGANIGFFTILASRLVGPQGRCVCIEALPATAAVLKKNIARNGCGNVRILEMAVSDRAGQIRIYRADRGNIGASTTLSQRGYSTYDLVDSAPLTDLLTDEEKRRARLVKIDVEGAELQVLEPVLANIEDFSDAVIFCVELSPKALRESGTSLQHLIARFGRHGFRAHYLEFEHPTYDYLDHDPNEEPGPPREYDALSDDGKAHIEERPHVDIVFARTLP